MTTTDKLNDPNLSEEEQDAIIGSFVRQQEREALRERWTGKLAKEHGVNRNTVVAGKARSARIRKMVIGVVSVAAAILLLIVFVLPHFNTVSGNELLAMKMENIEVIKSRGTGNETDDVLRGAFLQAVDAEDYPAAAIAGESLLEDAGATAEDRLNLGYTYLSADRFASAETIFRDLLASASVYQTEARYYLALALLGQDENTEAFRLLELIKSTDGRVIYSDAQDLLSADWQ